MITKEEIKQLALIISMNLGISNKKTKKLVEIWIRGFLEANTEVHVQ